MPRWSPRSSRSRSRSPSTGWSASPSPGKRRKRRPSDLGWDSDSDDDRIKRNRGRRDAWSSSDDEYERGRDNRRGGPATSRPRLPPRPAHPPPIPTPQRPLEVSEDASEAKMRWRRKAMADGSFKVIVLHVNKYKVTLLLFFSDYDS